MIYNFDELIPRKNTDSVKWNLFEPDVLPLWVADMDFISPEPVIRALRERVEHGVFGYPRDPIELRSVIQEHLHRRYNWEIETDSIMLLSGVVMGINLTCHALASPGQAALVQTPVYGPFLTSPRNAHLSRQDSELVQRPDGTYEIDFDNFEDTISDQTAVFILCNPHNPVGRVFRRDELEQMADICIRHNVAIISDEIHCDMIYTGHKHVPIASINPEIANHTITLMAPSKTYNVAGLGCAFAVVTNPEIRQKLERARMGLAGGPNLLSMTAALAAFRDGQEWLDQLLVYLEKNRDVLKDFVDTNLPGVVMGKPEGTYLAWLDWRSLGLGNNPCEFFVKHARVALGDGNGFGNNGAGFVRVNFGCPRSILEQALDRMQQALAREIVK
jgi:cysteine-S-conjugate beta-lyase